MEYYIETRSKKPREFIDAILPSMLEQTKLAKNKRFLHIKFDRDLEDMGTMIPFLGIDTYLIVLKPTRSFHELGVTLAHELVHVAQVAKGKLKFVPKGRTWQGKFYNRRVPYLSQPWEVQAFQQQEILFRRAAEK
jgi:hypothetical protein